MSEKRRQRIQYKHTEVDESATYHEVGDQHYVYGTADLVKLGLLIDKAYNSCRQYNYCDGSF